MMRALAMLALWLYPRRWRRRYADEVLDLVQARPIRFRTVADLVRGAFDAWINRRLVPGEAPMRIPTPAFLTAGALALIYLWNPGIREVSSLNSTWSRALESGFAADLLAQVASALFLASAIAGLIALVLLLVTAADALVLVVGILLIFMALLVGGLYVATAYFGFGFPMGRLGDAMTGGFFVPIVLAILLPILTIAAADPLLAHGVRFSGKLLAGAAALNAAAWVPIAALVVMGVGTGMSGRWVAMVAASAICSCGMSAFVAHSALARGRQATEQPAAA